MSRSFLYVWTDNRDGVMGVSRHATLNDAIDALEADRDATEAGHGSRTPVRIDFEDPMTKVVHNVVVRKAAAH